ncbi:MAG: hypothetical protein AAFP70_12955, partial [Calditrichota bacterium]
MKNPAANYVLGILLLLTVLCPVVSADDAPADTAKAWNLFRQAQTLANASKMDSSNLLYMQAREIFEQAAQNGMSAAWGPYMQCKIHVGGNLLM